MVEDVLNGNMKSDAYEDQLREMFGLPGYVAFALDEVVKRAVEQVAYHLFNWFGFYCRETRSN